MPIGTPPRSSFRHAVWGLLLALGALSRGRTSGRGRGEEELDRLDEHFHVLVEHSSDIITVLSRDGTIRYQSPSIRRVLGYAPEDRIGRNVFEDPLVHPEDLPAKRDFIARAVAKPGEVISAEFRLRHADGSWRSIAAVGRNMLDDPRVAGIIANYRDITEQREAQAELELYRLMVETAADYAIFRLDPAGHIASWNAGAERITGYRAAEIIGHHYSCFYPPEDNAPAVAGSDLEVAAAAGRFEDEGWRLRKDGSRFWANVVTTVLRGGHGRLTGFSTITRDLSERRQAEESLRTRARQQAAVARLGLLGLATPELVTLMDEVVALVARTLEVEYCKVLELLPAGDALLLRAGVGWHDGYIGHATVASGVESQAGYTLASSSPVIVENLRTETRFSGPPLLHEHGVVSGMSGIIAGQGRPFGVLGAHTTRQRRFTDDDSHFLQAVANVLAEAIERYRAQAEVRQLNERLEQSVLERTRELEQANAALEAFSVWVSHDLRTPVHGMQGLAQALLEDHGWQLDPAGREYAGRISRAAASMDRLIEDLLAYARLSRADVSCQPVDLNRVVREALGELVEDIGERGAEVMVSEALPRVVAHPTVLGQVIVNLLSNATKFVAPGTRPHVAVWADQHGDQVRLWVADNGIGIPPQNQERVFGAFERLHGVEAYPGTGIGLAIVRRGVERMGGQVGIESGPGGGSRFWIELPGNG